MGCNTSKEKKVQPPSNEPKAEPSGVSASSSSSSVNSASKSRSSSVGSGTQNQTSQQLLDQTKEGTEVSPPVPLAPESVEGTTGDAEDSAVPDSQRTIEISLQRQADSLRAAAEKKLSEVQVAEPIGFQGEMTPIEPSSPPRTPSNPQEATTPQGLTPRVTSPPPQSAVDVNEFLKTKSVGIYLSYEASNNGNFLANYSKTPVDGALAFSRCGDYFTIPEFKFKQHKSIQTKTNLGRKNYFEGWCVWLKEARRLQGEFVLLPALEDMMISEPQKFPSFRMLFLQGNKVVEATLGAKSVPINLRFTDVAAIVPAVYTGYDDILRRGAVIERNEFITQAKIPQDYSYIEFN